MKNRVKSYGNKILRKPFFNFILLYFLITAVVLVAGYLYYNYQKAKIKDARFTYLNSMAQYQYDQIKGWLSEKYADLQFVKESVPVITSSDIRYPLDKAPAGVDEWFSKLKKFYHYENFNLLTDKLKLIYGSGKTLSASDSLLSKNALDSNLVLFSDTDEKTADQLPLRFYLPVTGKTKNGDQKKVLILYVDPKFTFGTILNRNVDKSPSFESLLVKPLNDSITYLNKLRFSEKRSESRYEENVKALYETSPIEEKRGFVKGKDYRKESVVALIQKVPFTSWFLITKLDEAEFYNPVNNLARIVFLVVFSFILLLALIFVFIWRKNIAGSLRKIHKAEVEKSKSENRFFSLVEGVKNIGIFLIDTEGIIISWNAGAEKIFGYPANEILGKNHSILFTEQERNDENAKTLLDDALKSEHGQSEGVRKRKDGSDFWANVVTTTLKDEDERIYGFIEIVNDLTEKRKNEEEIKKSRDFYLKLLDEFPNPVWRSNDEGKLEYFNKAWLIHTGRNSDDEIGDGWMSDIHPDDRNKFVKEFSNSLKSRARFTIEYRLKNSKREYKWFVNYAIPYFDFSGNFAGFLGSCYDINERIKYEDTINTLLSISEKLYASLEINQILDSLVTESIKLTGAESGYACIKSADEFRTQRYFNGDHWEYCEQKYSITDPAVQKLESAGGSVLIENNSADLYGSADLFQKYQIKQALATPLYTTEGELIGFFEVHHKEKKNDISSFNSDALNLMNAVAKNASVAISKSLNYEKLRQTEIQLRESESELRNLAAQIQYAREAERQNIAREVHDELGQLFTGINLNISMIAELLENGQKLSISEILNEIHSVQEFVNKGIQTVRDISGSLRSYVLDHLGIVPAIQEYCREVERISGIKCDFNSEYDHIYLSDENNVALFRIIQEALTNVMRHANATKINVSLKKELKGINLTVTDNGIGIDAKSNISERSMGIIGMKERAIFLGGRLNIISGGGNGTTISLFLPEEKIMNENGEI